MVSFVFNALYHHAGCQCLTQLEQVHERLCAAWFLPGTVQVASIDLENVRAHCAHELERLEGETPEVSGHA